MKTRRATRGPPSGWGEQGASPTDEALHGLKLGFHVGGFHEVFDEPRLADNDAQCFHRSTQ